MKMDDEVEWIGRNETKLIAIHFCFIRLFCFPIEANFVNLFFAFQVSNPFSTTNGFVMKTDKTRGAWNAADNFQHRMTSTQAGREREEEREWEKRENFVQSIRLFVMTVAEGLILFNQGHWMARFFFILLILHRYSNRSASQNKSLTHFRIQYKSVSSEIVAI